MPPPRSSPLGIATGRRPGGRGLAGSGSSYGAGLLSQSYMDVAAVAPEQVRERERERTKTKQNAHVAWPRARLRAFFLSPVLSSRQPRP